MLDQPVRPITPSDANFAREMLCRIAFIRAFEAKAFALTTEKPPKAMGSMHYCAGQEAVPLGASAALRDDDQVLCTYRGHGWAIACGVDPRSVMAELCQRAEGLNGGRAGSALLTAPHTRFIGENSIIGAGTTIACGVGIANTLKKNGRVVVVSIGDGAMNQGAVHEAFVFAVARKLPIIFVVENNGWAEMTATHETVKVERLALRAKGYGMPAVTIDGTDPMNVRDTISVAAERARNGGGPSLVECKVPRLWGHYNRDIEHYRPKADRLAAEEADPLKVLTRRLVDACFITEEDASGLVEQQEKVVAELTDAVLASPFPDPATAIDHVVAQRVSSRAPEVLETKELNYIDAVNAALRAELETDPATIVYGEDVGKAGGIFGASRYLQRDFGEERVFDTPIAENAILGSAVGASISGLKPIVEIMWADFLFVAFDQLINQASNIRYLSRGLANAPLVVRTQQGSTPGYCAQHSQSIEAMLAHIPGLRVGLAATPEDAYSLLRAAAADPDPCIIIEARALYQTKGKVNLTKGAEPIGKARLRRRGSDVAIVTWGTMVEPAIKAARLLEDEKVSVSVLDLRWLNPLDEETLVSTVRASKGNVLIVHEAVKTGGFGAEIFTRIHEILGCETKRVERLATPDIRLPSSPVLQQEVLPNEEKIANICRIIAKH